MNAAPQIVFLTYASRSGSTFLSSLLDAIPGIRVTIENDFLSRLYERRFDRKKPKKNEEIIRFLYSDPHFLEWGIEREQLAQILEKIPQAISIKTIFLTVLSIYFESMADRVWIAKIPRIENHITRLRSAFPEAKFIHIVRDPRGAVGSQLQSRSLHLRLNAPMAVDPYAAALNWQRTIERIDTEGRGAMFTVRYEDLVADTDPAMSEIKRFLSLQSCVEDIADETEVTYFESIPERQKALHSNVAEGVTLEHRALAWKDELIPEDGLLIERATRNGMARFGYRPYYVNIVDGASIRVRFRRAIGIVRGLLRGLRRWSAYTINPKALANRLRARRAKFER